VGNCRPDVGTPVEPYSGSRPNLSSVERVPLDLPEGDLSAAAVRVRAADGRADTILTSDHPERAFDIGVNFHYRSHIKQGICPGIV